MHFQLLVLVLVFFYQVSNAHGRKPAVEDFVGVDIEHPEATPQGTEHLFNFEKEMDQFQKNPQSVSDSTMTTSVASERTFTGYLGIFLILSLPAFISLLVMRKMKLKAREESLANLKVLEEYRKNKEESKKRDDELKKAS